MPYRAYGFDDHGRRLYPRPTVAGTQTAIVVGVAGLPSHVDREVRVQLQFHWRRGSRSASRLAHPSGEDNTPACAALGVWVRVAVPYVGANFGAVFSPRVEQEAVVCFVEGDIDRPIVTGYVYNGRGATDAQYNEVAAGGSGATGNAPAWFPRRGHTESCPRAPRRALGPQDALLRQRNGIPPFNPWMTLLVFLFAPAMLFALWQAWLRPRTRLRQEWIPAPPREPNPFNVVLPTENDNRLREKAARIVLLWTVLAVGSGCAVWAWIATRLFG